MRILATVAVLAALSAGAAAAPVGATGGDYVFAGGTPRQQAQVRAALQASSFDWSVVPRRITIHIAPGTDSFATPGEIWLDADLLDAGRFAWSTVQHEFAHQIDFFVLDDAARATIRRAVGAASWHGGPHASRGAERFAETLVAVYWDAPDNLASAYAQPAAFRAALAKALGGERSLATAKPRPKSP